ncbi:MAG: type II toxin-antitoxin system RelE/ParE family toxin [Holophagales bacterium]|nr:type II toxin-antitoxin system RelE/ParE family toxin [Holophagales bacterium]
MNWRIDVHPSAEKQYLRLDATTRQRLKTALLDLQGSDQPLNHPRVRPLRGTLKGDYRTRVGGWRILMTPDREARGLHVYAILRRGDAY